MRIGLSKVALFVVATGAAACSANGNVDPGKGGTTGGSSGGPGQGGGTQTGNGGSGTTSGGASTGQGGGTPTGNGGSGTSQGGMGTSQGGGTQTGNGGSGTGTTGGAAAGGAGGTTPGQGGAGTTTGGSGGTGTGTNPPGYWTYKDWKGCAWTGVDVVAGTTTTITPKDFTAGLTNGAYCVKGSTFGSYDAVALLGFNLNEPAAGTSCAYKPVDTSKAGPPGVTMTGTGIAVNYVKNTASRVRIQIQGPNGASDANNRWCYELKEPKGPSFAPFADFWTQCWNVGVTPAMPTGNKYNGEPISAVVFLVPGVKDQVTPFDYCINGFANGTSAADAPMGGTTGGPLMGTIGGPGGTDLDFQRVKISAGGKSYIIQNNNWGNPGGSDQTIQYVDNSFTITSSTGNKGGGGEPASFPSIYIGGNGDVQNGAYSTHSDDNLPKQVSTIQSIQTTMKYNRASGDYNASYDVWFSATNPPPAGYKDGVSGFIMVWLYKPANNGPIGGTPARTGVTISGVPGTWDVYAGPRGGSGPNSSAPVISYVAASPHPVLSLTFDLNKFIQDAVTTGAAGQKIQSSWYLTDVFGGFEIWTGSAANGLKLEQFSAVVQ